MKRGAWIGVGISVAAVVIAGLTLHRTYWGDVASAASTEMAIRKDVDGLLGWKTDHEADKQRILSDIYGQLKRQGDRQEWIILVLYRMAARDSLPMPALPSGVNLMPAPPASRGWTSSAWAGESSPISEKPNP